jgi:hypothetical protein
MAAVPYKVYVVVDREFGEKLSDLERGMPVWIVDTPTNRPVAQCFGKSVQMKAILPASPPSTTYHLYRQRNAAG